MYLTIKRNALRALNFIISQAGAQARPFSILSHVRKIGRVDMKFAQTYP
jgi:hypothetical protein